jgi:serine protease 16
MIDNGDLKQLENDFYACAAIDGKKDIYQFVSNLADAFMGVVQYNLEVPGQTISSLCQQMTSSEDSYANLQVLFKVRLYHGGHKIIHQRSLQRFLNESEQTCSDNSWSSAIAQMSNTTVTRGGFGVGMRQWIYQTCTQFGYCKLTMPYSFRFILFDISYIFFRSIL